MPTGIEGVSADTVGGEPAGASTGTSVPVTGMETMEIKYCITSTAVLLFTRRMQTDATYVPTGTQKALLLQYCFFSFRSLFASLIPSKRTRILRLEQ
jgi:hypothetical protein